MSLASKPDRQFDLIVIGSGSAGDPAAMEARTPVGVLAAAMHAFPTFAEGIEAAAIQM